MNSVIQHIKICLRKSVYRFFQNKECEFFPCKKVKKLNCLFCFCPLYNIDCGGKFTILENGWKDCSECSIIHEEDGYDHVIRMLKKAKETKL